MAKHFLDVTDVAAVLKEQGGHGVAEDVAAAWAVDAGIQEAGFDDVGEAARDEGAAFGGEEEDVGFFSAIGEDGPGFVAVAGDVAQGSVANGDDAARGPPSSVRLKLK